MKYFTVRPYYLKHETLHIPEFHCENPETAEQLEYAYRKALDTVFNINCVYEKPFALAPSEMMNASPLDAPVLCAGSSYNNVWNRDGSYEVIMAVALMAPRIAESNLRLLVADNGIINASVWEKTFTEMQYWDRVIWIIAAQRLYSVYHNKKFLDYAVEVGCRSFEWQEEHYFNAEFGLFTGPAFFHDPICAWPREFTVDFDPDNDFVGHYPEVLKNMTLSTNCIYYGAWRALADLLDEVEGGREKAECCRRKAELLKENIRRHFFRPDAPFPAYFVRGVEKDYGKPEFYQEASGLGFALMFDIPDQKQKESIFRNVHLEPNGIPNVWPNFWNDLNGRGRGQTHGGYLTPTNVVIHPQSNGLWAVGCARNGQTELLQSEIENMFRLVKENRSCCEIYHARSGDPSLCGTIEVKKDQCWGATAVLGSIIYGVFGIQYTADSMVFQPALPGEWGALSLLGVAYGDALFDVELRGAGACIDRFEYDGVAQEKPEVRFGTQGRHRIVITMK